METIENCVQKLRKEKGDTQESLAEAVGVTRQTVISIERGNYAPSVLLALKISEHFGVSVNDIFKYK